MSNTQSVSHHSSAWYVYLAVIAGGAAVLALELLGTRLLAPFSGADIYLWSSLISVTLIALSCGYALGGRMADKNPRIEKLALLLGLAGLWICFVPWLRLPLFSLAQSLDLRLGVLLIAFVLFFPPLTLLGMVTPYALRLQVARVESVGTTAGNLYAVSTVASVIAALLTGFVLIPNMGVQRLVLGTGLLLIVTSATGFIARSRLHQAAISILILVFGLFLWGRTDPARSANPETGMIAVETSAYADIRVVERDSIRYLLIDGGSHSSVDPVTFETHMPYVNVLDISRNYFSHPGSMLTVGLGAGSVVKSFVKGGWQVDAVEIDPAVINLAHTYFGLGESEGNIVTMDGRQYLNRTDKSYDVIVMDAYGSSYIPFHLVTSEAFGLAKAHLSPNGVMAMNMECVGWYDPLVASVAATARTQFKHVLELPIVEPPNEFGNVVLLASDLDLGEVKDPPVPTFRFSPEYDRAHAWDNRFVPDSTALVLTDDRNPVDNWSGRINRAARALYHTNLDTRGIAW